MRPLLRTHRQFYHVLALVGSEGQRHDQPAAAAQPGLYATSATTYGK